MPLQADSAVVIGGSAGALAGVRKILAALPEDFPAAVLVVFHFPSPAMAETLGSGSVLPVEDAVDGVTMAAGRVYVAPGDRHLLVSGAKLAVTRGPRENLCRPAIDPTFRTAAKHFGHRLTGVLLSGMQSDGSHGLAVIKSLGGTTVAQDPEESDFPQMPRSAIERVGVDHVLAIDDIARLVSLTAAAETAPAEAPVPSGQERPGLENPPPGGLTSIACPDCGGPLWEQQQENLVHYRCHVGHAYTDDVLEAAQVEFVEGALWAAVRALEEQVELSRRMARRARDAGDERAASRHEEAVADGDRQASVIYHLLTGPRHVPAAGVAAE